MAALPASSIANASEPPPNPLPVMAMRPKIGLPPSAWAPNPLDVPGSAATAVVAVEAPKNPWNAGFILGLLALLALLNFSLSLLFHDVPGMGQDEATPRLTVTRAPDNAELSTPPSGTGIYRHESSLPGLSFPGPHADSIPTPPLPGSYAASNDTY